MYRAKNLQVAQEKFLTAETLRHSNDDIKAVIFYSQSVLKTPITGKYLISKLISALCSFIDKLYLHALFGRLKSLFSLGKFESVIIDIQSLLKLSSENSIRGELFAWLSLSYTALKENSKAEVALNLSKKLLPNSKKIEKILKHNIKAAATCIDNRNTPKISENEHVNFQYASRKLSLETSPEKGRFFIAADEIKTGEILMVEPAAVSCLLPEKFGTHCHHCFERYATDI